MCIAYDVKCTVHFLEYTSIQLINITVISLSFNAIKTSKIQFDVNVANGVAIGVANDVLLARWMEVYPFRLNQSKSLLYAEIK